MKLKTLLFLLLPGTLLLQAAPPRLPVLDDMHRFKDVGDPRCSPDGQWVAYTLTSVDVAGDKRDTDIWMISADGKENIRVTSSPESESSPRFSPDGRYLAFLSSRPGTGKNKGAQIWLLDRRGGEAQQWTDSKARISGFDWAPDSKRMLVLLKDEEEDVKKLADKDKEKPRPIVVDRYSFKRDGAGYLTGKQRTRLHLFDIESKKFDLLTTENFDESGAVWSPDGSKIAFVSNHAPDWDRVPSSDIYVVDAKAGSTPRRLTTFAGTDRAPVWSPDSKLIAYLKGSELRQGEYNMDKLAVVPAAGGESTVVTAALDRGVMMHDFTPDGQSLRFLVADDMVVYPASVSVKGGTVEKLLNAKQVMMSAHSTKACTVTLISNDATPADIYIIGPAGPRKLTNHNDALMAELQVAPTEEIRYKTKDGSEAHGLLTKPFGYETGKKYPLLLRIHGGPNAQDAHSYTFERQLLAANGYAVLNINYRGSSGRGQDYTATISRDWGNKEVIDLLAGVDAVVASGLADSDKLGVGGWSYGGILTNYLIASTTRFKGAISGAGVAFPLAFYGHDQYIRQYDNEIQPPWRGGLEPWLKISYPFLHADRIKTPTLFMGGDKDFNVPLLGSEQMYQALRNVGTESELIIYPGENHGIARPSFQRDRMQRYLDWYARTVKGEAKAAAVTASGN